MNKTVPVALTLASLLTLSGCAGTTSDFECNATTSDTCMTIEQAKAVKVDFGRFNGWTLGDIAMKNPGDLAWYVKNYSGHNLALKAGATKLLEAVGQMAS